MARFLNTSKAYAEIEDLVSKAKQQLVLISPYIQIAQPLLERLKDLDKKGVKITLVCRQEDLKPDVANNLTQLRNLNLYFHQNLHAKCFYNENSMVITSLNLYDYSQQNNREMGILVTVNGDKEIYSEALDEAEFIIRSATPDKVRKQAQSSIKGNEIAHQVGNIIKGLYATATKQEGFCIRCGNRIPLDLEAPYCRQCYGEWKKWKNPDYEEVYCHECGKRSVTMDKPLCRSCFKRS